MLIALVVFVMGFYSFLVHGRRVYRWALRYAPLRRSYVHRLVAAFHETGRGLLIGVGLTAAAQGGVAAIGYLIVGVPHALVLGLLTAIAALIPSVGSGLVWVPVSIALTVTGRPGAAVAVLVVGLVVSTVDNFVRPMLSRYGQLRLPMFVLFVAMLGGITGFGTWGLILGPLFVRLSIEGLKLLRMERDEATREELERPGAARATEDQRGTTPPPADRGAMGPTPAAV
jgi:predicted PurR-regulated permease PerM